MPSAPITTDRARKGKPVTLRQDLPLGFKNKYPVPKGAKGYVESDGFVNGQLKVYFPLYAGDEHVEFNSFSVGDYLEADPFSF